MLGVGTSFSEGYTPKITGQAEGGYIITNTHMPETVSITGSKTWNDEGNEGARPESIIIRLYADGNQVTENQ